MKKIIILKFILMLPVLLLIKTAYAQEIDTSIVVSEKSIEAENSFNFLDTVSKQNSVTTIPIDSLIAFGKTYLGLPYKTTKRAPWALDCSGYIAMLYAKFGVEIPHSSSALASITKTVDLKDAQVGDLLFFKGRDTKKSRVGHVALIIEVYNDHVIMMHSTSSKGIITEPYPSKYYYNNRFIKVGRLVIR